MSGACLPNEKSSARSQTTAFGHLLETSESSPVRALLLLNSMIPVLRPLRQRNRLGPKWFQRARFRNQAICLHVPDGETRNCDVEDQIERDFRQGPAREPYPCRQHQGSANGSKSCC